MTQQEIESVVANVLASVSCELKNLATKRSSPDSNQVTPRRPRVLDWDRYDLHRNVAIVDQPAQRNDRTVRFASGRS